MNAVQWIGQLLKKEPVLVATVVVAVVIVAYNVWAKGAPLSDVFSEQYVSGILALAGGLVARAMVWAKGNLGSSSPVSSEKPVVPPETLAADDMVSEGGPVVPDDPSTPVSGHIPAGPDLGPTGPNHPEEEAILESIYGPPSPAGLYHGPALEDDEDEMEPPGPEDLEEDE